MYVHTYNVCVCLKKTQFESMAQKKKKNPAYIHVFVRTDGHSTPTYSHKEKPICITYTFLCVFIAHEVESTQIRSHTSGCLTAISPCKKIAHCSVFF